MTFTKIVAGNAVFDSSETGILEKDFEKRLGRARNSWPTVRLSANIFHTYLAERLPDAASPSEALNALNTSDLYLACACAGNDERALVQFDAYFGPKITQCLYRLNPSDTFIEDMRQQVRHKLFVPEHGCAPDIVKYQGTGSLAAWLRVVATRMAIRRIKRAKREFSGDVRIMDAIARGVQDPELDYLKQLYRNEFKQAFHQAMEALSPRDRNLLRYTILDKMSIDVIGDLYNVHRSTAARWIEKVRRTLAETTRNEMLQSLDIDDGEYDSIVRIINTRLEYSVVRYLESDPA